MDDDQDQQRYWLPYWTNPPPRPPVRSQPSPPIAPSPSRRPSHPQPTAPRGAASPQAQVSSSRPSPSLPAPLAPIREPRNNHLQQQQHPPPSNSIAAGAAPTKEPPKPHGKAKGKDHKTPKEKHEEEKKKKKETKSKEQPKEKHKEEEEEKKKKETKSKEPVSKPKEEVVFEELANKKSHGGEQGKQHKEIKTGVAGMVHKAGASSGPGHERPGGTRVITLAGENKGASMMIGAKSEDKERHGHRLDGGEKEMGGKGMTALINSNVQVINNSMLLKSSCSGGDPGVHLKLSAQSNSKDKQQQQQQRASVGGGRATAAQK